MVSSTSGSSTKIGWNRRSRAASFSTYLRYSLSVVAPMHCSSPRESAGLSMFDASMAPSAPPAPMIVCSSSMKSITLPAVTISFMTFLSRSSNSPRYLVPATREARSRARTRLPREDLGHVVAHDALREALDDRGLADARFADEHRVVLGPTGQDLDDPLDLLGPPDDGVELALAGEVVRSRENSSRVGVARLGADEATLERFCGSPPAPLASPRPLMRMMTSRSVLGEMERLPMYSEVALPFSLTAASRRCSVPMYSCPMLRASSAESSMIFFPRLEGGTSPRIRPPLPRGMLRSTSSCISAMSMLTRLSVFTATPSPSLSSARTMCSG